MIRKVFAIVLVAAIVVFSGARISVAQNRAVGAQSFILDDGHGHTITIQINGTLSGSFVYNIPVPPAGNPPAGFVNVGTSGQTLYWNSVNSDWEASSVITNNTNGDGTNVTITAPFISTTTTNLGTTAGSAVNIGNSGNSAVTIASGGTASSVNIASNTVGTNNFFGSGATGTNNFGTHSPGTNFFGGISHLNAFGNGSTTNQYGGGAASNTFGSGNPGGPQSNNFGSGNSAITYTNTIGQATVAGSTVNTTIGGGPGTNTVAITSGAAWSVTAAGVLTAVSHIGNGAGLTSLNGANITANTIPLSAISNAGATNTYVITDNAGTISWQPGFSLPYAATVSNAGALFSVTNSGAGDAIDASAGTGAAVQATGNVVIKSPNATPSKLVLQTPSNGANTTSFQTQAQAGGSITYTLPAALPSSGQQLAVSGVSGTTATLAWQSAGAAVAFTRVPVTGGTTYGAATTDNFIGVSGAGTNTTINLPTAAAAGSGHTIIIKDEALALSGTHTITINATGGDNLEDGGTETFLTTTLVSTTGYNVGQVLRYYSDGVSKWLLW